MSPAAPEAAAASGETLADTLELVLPFLRPALVEPAALGRLRQAGQALLPSLPGGFECRLGDGAAQMDLLQRIPRESGYPARLRAMIVASGLDEQPGWQRVRDFCEAWTHASAPLSQGITHIWLEFDLDSDEAARTPSPSIFAGLDTRLAPVPEGLEVLRAALPALAGPVPEELWASVERCARACRERAVVSHVAVMLARAQAGARLNVARVAQGQLAPYLRAAGWPGPLAEVEQLAEWAYRSAEWVTLCLDLGEGLYPKLGLECSFDPTHADQEARWAGLVEACAAHGVCTLAQRDGLLAWQGLMDPVTTPQPWPAHLIAQSLMAPAEALMFIRRRLSHIKLVHQPGRPLEAKGYLGFETVWG